MILATTNTPRHLRMVSNNATPYLMPGPQRGGCVISLPQPPVIMAGTLIASKAFSMFGIEGMVPAACDRCLLSEVETAIYRAGIEKIAASAQAYRPFLKEAITIYNAVADYPVDLQERLASDVIAASKINGSRELLLAFNPSAHEPKEVFIRVNCGKKDQLTNMRVLYGYDFCSSIPVNSYRFPGEMINYIKLYLKPQQLVVLSNG